MMWDEWENSSLPEDDDSHVKFEFFSVLSKFKDYYKILEVNYDATEEDIRSNYIRLALLSYLCYYRKWHPDKQKNENTTTTSRFQEINEAYQVLSDPIKWHGYDKHRMFYTYDNNIMEYLNRYKGLILTCNGLGMKCSIW